MFWGILIGIVLSVLCVVIAMSAGCKELKPLSYIIVVLALIAFCIEGVSFVNAIQARKNVDETVTALQEAALTYLPRETQDYRLGLAEATGLKIGLRLVYPYWAKYIEPEDLVGYTVSDLTEVLRKAVLRNATSKIWMNILYMVITLVLGTVLVVVTGEKHGGKSRGGSRRPAGGRPQNARPQSSGRPRNVHRSNSYHSRRN